MTRDAHDVVRQIAEYAEAIAFQAGVGSSETAGQIVSFLWERPSLMPAFMAGTLSAVDTGMLDHHNGVLSWHGQDGGIYRPDPSKARFPAPPPEPDAFDRMTEEELLAGIDLVGALSTHTAAGAGPVEEADAKAVDFVLVPREPTTAMLDAAHEVAISCFEGDETCFMSDNETEAVFRAMLAVAPPTSTIPSEPEAKGTRVPDDVRRLVIAARNVAFDDAPSAEALKALDDASEAFAARVPWENEP